MLRTVEENNTAEPRISRTRKSSRSEVSTSTRKFCVQCYRYDYHKPVKVTVVAKVLVIIFTLGIAALFWPSRCVCCGTMRY